MGCASDTDAYMAEVTISGAVSSFADFGFNFINATTTVDLSAYTGIVFNIKALGNYPAIGNYVAVECPDSDSCGRSGKLFPL